MNRELRRWNDLTLNEQASLIRNSGSHEDDLRDGDHWFDEDGALLYRIYELHELAKVVAQNAYIKGWLETHPDETEELQVPDTHLFLKDGTFVAELEE
jgi:hypothetical protein